MILNYSMVQVLYKREKENGKPKISRKSHSQQRTKGNLRKAINETGHKQQ
jgi:hypothetical protein